MRCSSDLLLRWSIGNQNTILLNDFSRQQFLEFLWMSKLSIASFQKWFPDACFVVLYNGTEYQDFINLFHSSEPKLFCPVDIIDQMEQIRLGKLENPYTFFPRGVWWKWVPFRIDCSKHEIAIDTDIICINEPKTWIDWMSDDSQIVVAPERYEKVLINTCGGFHTQPILSDRQPLNCGIVGQKKNNNYSEQFFNVCSSVDIGSTRNSLFIDEQGAINTWVRSLELTGVKSHVLDFMKNAWMRDFISFFRNGITVETVHAVTWYKKLIIALKDIFTKKVLSDDYSDARFISDILMKAASFEGISQHVLYRQLGGSLEHEYLPK